MESKVNLEQRIEQLFEERFQPQLNRIEALMKSILERETIKDYYSVEEFARIVGNAEYTCREWCRRGRIHADKKASGRGRHQSWVISHQELLRYRQEGLLPSST